MRAWLSKTIGFFIALAFVLQLATPILAQEDIGGITITPGDMENAINSPTPNLANTTAYVVYTVVYMLTKGVNPGIGKVVCIDPENCPDAETGEEINYYQRPSSLAHAVQRSGLIGGSAYLLSSLVGTKPASGTEYVAYMASQSRFAPQPVYAQGFGVGFGALRPILATWAAFRDVAYFLLTFMFLVVGLLIIFRKKVSGNVAVTVQNALPRLVLTLILITFSYAIAGFIVDLMFWAIYFVIIVFSGLFENGEIVFTGGTIFIKDKTYTVADFALNKNLFELLFAFFIGGGANNAAQAITNLVAEAMESIPIIGESFKIIRAVDFLGATEWTIALIFQLVIGVAILVQIFRVFFQLLMSYAGFVINVVLSPFILLQGAWPGKDPFMEWVRNLIAGLAPFVVVIFMILMSLVLSGVSTRDGVGYQNEASREKEGTGLQLPLITGGSDDIDIAGEMMGILALGFIMLLPEAVNMTKKFLGASGGPFSDEFKNKALGNFKKGWEGGEVVPGLGFTKIGGVKTALPMIGATAAAGAAGAARAGYVHGERAWQQGAGQNPVQRGLRTAGEVLINAPVGAAYGVGIPAAYKAGKSKVVQKVSSISKIGQDLRQIREDSQAQSQYQQSMDNTNPNVSTNSGPSTPPNVNVNNPQANNNARINRFGRF